MQSFRSSMVFLLVVILAFGYIYFVDRHQLGTEEKERVEKNLFKFEPDKVVSLKITSGDQTVELQKDGGIWKIKSPVVTEADPSSVQQVLSELSTMESRRAMQFQELKNNNDTLEKSGLSPAATKIEFATGNKPEDRHLLLLGRKIFASDYVYARTSSADNSMVYLISTDSRDAVDKKLDDLRSRVVIKVDASHVNRAGLRVAAINNQVGADYEIEKSNNTWSLQKPLTARAESQKVNDWLSQLDSLRVKKFVTEDGSSLNQYGLNTPAFQIWIQTAPSDSVSTLLIGSSVPGSKGEVYAKNLKGDSVFILDQTSIQNLIDGLPNSRDKKILTFDAPSISAVRLESKGKVIAVTKVKESWFLDDNTSLKADPSTISTFLDGLNGLQTLSFVNDAPSDLKAYGLDKPQAKVTLTEVKGDKKETIDLLLGKVDKQQMYAKTSLEPFIYALPLSVMDKWPKEEREWRDLAVMNMVVDDVLGFEVTPASGSSFAYRQTKPGVFVTDEAGKTVNADKAKNQLAVFTLLRATKWIGAAQPGYGLNKPQFKLEAKTKGASKVLLIGSSLPSGGLAAQVQGEAECFELNSSDLKLLTDSPLESGPAPAPAAGVDNPKK